MNVAIRKILYAVDLSNTSSRAFDYALSLAKAQDARLHLLHVVEPMSDEMRVTLSMFVADPQARRQALTGRREAVRALLEERQAAFWAELHDDAARHLVDEVEVVEGFPAEAILKCAERLPAEMIVMGSHAHGVSHTFLGTVAKRVLRRSRIPTLIVPHAETSE